MSYKFSAKTINITGGRVIVDGVDMTDSLSNKTANGTIEITVNGDVEILNVDQGSVKCGSAKFVTAGGSVKVGNMVTGDIDAGGSVTVDGDVTGNIDAGGSIKCKKVGGSSKAGGSITIG